jgi:hypothetical protein
MPGPAGEPATDAQGFEVPPVVAAADFLGPEEMAGPHHRVRPGAVTDGYLAHFTIDSDFGTYTCVSAAEARQRVHEIGALAYLSQVSKGDVFAEALKQSAMKPVDAVKGIAQDPAGAARQLPKTVGHFFKKAGQAVAAGVGKVGDSISGEAGGAGVAQGAEDVGKGLLGYNRALLQVSREVGIDPYTDNQPLKDKAEEIAWVFFAGGSPINLGVGIVSGGASIALKATVATGMPSEVYDLTPTEILVRNQEAMAAIGVPQPVQQQFLNNPVLTPTLRMSILDSLAALGPLQGRAEVVGLAAGLTERDQAEFLARAVHLLADAGSSGRANFQRVAVHGRLPAATDASGHLWVPAPVDFVSWTGDIAEFARRQELASTRPVLAPRGAKFTAKALQGFQQAGWRFEGF